MPSASPPEPPSGTDSPFLIPLRPGADWLVLHSRPRCEKKLLDTCRHNHLPAYLPILVRRHVYGGRVRHHSVPLFPGYLFCAADRDQRRFLEQNDQVANVLVDARPEILRGQILHLHAALNVGAAVEVLPYIVQGKTVRILGGMLKGTEGVVQHIKGRDRVVLNIELIGQSVAVEIDGALLAPVN